MSPVISQHPCPDNLKDQAEEINGWIKSPHHKKCVPYWCVSDLGAEFKFRIEDITTHEVIVENLQPKYTDGHTCAMFLIAMETQCRKSFAEGLKSAAATVYEKICQNLGIRPEPIPYVINR